MQLAETSAIFNQAKNPPDHIRTLLSKMMHFTSILRLLTVQTAYELQSWLNKTNPDRCLAINTA